MTIKTTADLLREHAESYASSRDLGDGDIYRLEIAAERALAANAAALGVTA